MKKRWLSSLPIHSLVTQPLFPSSFICCTFLFLLLRSDSRVDRNPSVLRIHQNVPGIVIKIWHGKVSGLEVYLMDEARSRLFSFPFLTYITPPRYLAVKTKERTRYKFSPHHPSLCIHNLPIYSLEMDGDVEMGEGQERRFSRYHSFSFVRSPSLQS